MTRAEKEIGIANKLYESRKTARFLGRDKYAEQVKPWMDGLRKRANGGDVLPVALEVAQKIQRSGDDVALLWLFAATVELCDPDEGTPQ
jgi:hypothetical protein